MQHCQLKPKSTHAYFSSPGPTKLDVTPTLGRGNCQAQTGPRSRGGGTCAAIPGGREQAQADGPKSAGKPTPAPLPPLQRTEMGIATTHLRGVKWETDGNWPSRSVVYGGWPAEGDLQPHLLSWWVQSGAGEP